MVAYVLLHLAQLSIPPGFIKAVQVFAVLVYSPRDHWNLDGVLKVSNDKNLDLFYAIAWKFCVVLLFSICPLNYN